MKIVVVGGAGLIGAKLTRRLREQGHEAIGASRRTGVDSVTGEGLAAAVDGAAVVVDVTSPSSSFHGTAREFFEVSTTNLRAAEETAGVGHHVVLSIVGAARLPDNDHYRGKVVQEESVRRSPIPHSIIRATQFFEFIETIAQAGAVTGGVRLPPVFLQPVAADDLVEIMTRFVVTSPSNATAEVAGPERDRLDSFVRRLLNSRNDRREVSTDPRARYFGAAPSERALVPHGRAILGETHFDVWLRRSARTWPAAP